MGKRKKIQERDSLYDFLHILVDGVTKASYSSVKFEGMERIPKDGAVIFAPNHTGALMDAMVMLAMDGKPKVFLARADIFKNPKLAKIFRFCKMMPIMRMRDGIEEVKKNNRTIEIAADVLKDRMPLCIFPEGTHQTKYSMLPLSKGIFRIALQAKELLGDAPLYIVPIGIRYGNFYRFRSTLRVRVGSPVDVGGIIAGNSDMTPQEQMNVMKRCLEERMKENILYIPNDHEYDAKNEICATVSEMQLEKHIPDGKDPMLAVNQEAIKRIDELKEKKPEIAKRLIALGDEASVMRKACGISMKSVAKQPTTMSILLKSLLLLATLPYTFATMVLTLPLTGVSLLLTKKFKDKAFHNSVRFVLMLLLWPLLMIIYTIVAYIYMSPLWATCAVLAAVPSPAVAQDSFRAMRLAVSDFKILRNKPLVAKYNEIKKMFFTDSVA